MPLSEKNFKKILETIEVANTLQDRNTMFHAVCESLEGLVPVSSAVYVPAGASPGEFSFSGSALYNVSEEMLLLFCLNYAPKHPYGQSGQWVHHLNEGVRLTDIISANKLAETEYCRDFQSLHPFFHELDCVLGYQGAPVGIIGFHRKRNEGNFSGSEKKIIDLLLPHLSRAIYNLNLKETLANSQGTGIIEVGKDGNPLYMNLIAKGIVREEQINKIPINDDRANPSFYRTSKGVYRVHTIPVWGLEKKIIFLEPLPAWKEIGSRLSEIDLTPRQEEIAHLVIRGLSNRDIAESLCIIEQTVKDHLSDIFEKARVRNRSELTAKVLNLAFKNR